MENMSYCRFQNTLKDLHDCERAMLDGEEDKLSPEEAKARRNLIRACSRIASEYEHELETKKDASPTP